MMPTGVKETAKPVTDCPTPSRGRRRGIPLIPLVLGGLFLFVGVAWLLLLTGVWTRTDVHYAEAVALSLLGAFLVAIALRPSNLRRVDTPR